jgi:hypothetical protein
VQEERRVCSGVQEEKSVLRCVGREKSVLRYLRKKNVFRSLGGEECAQMLRK